MKDIFAVILVGGVLVIGFLLFVAFCAMVSDMLFGGQRDDGGRCDCDCCATARREAKRLNQADSVGL